MRMILIYIHFWTEKERWQSKERRRVKLNCKQSEVRLQAGDALSLSKYCLRVWSSSNGTMNKQSRWQRLCSFWNIYWANPSLSLLVAASICVSNSPFRTAVLISSNVGTKSFSLPTSTATLPLANSKPSWNWLSNVKEWSFEKENTKWR